MIIKKNEEGANWIVWAGWAGWTGNHDRRIDGAECSNCGQKHPVVFGSLDKLSNYCPNCGSTMSVSLQG